MADPKTKAAELWLDALAWAAILPVLLTPLANPDLFWHLASAERILAGGLPRDDSFSFTRMGWPWVDFEWLVQLAYFGVFKTAGWWGLWALKVLLMAFCGLSVWALSELYALRGSGRRALLLCWAALALARSELKPELASTLFFTLELWLLERHRLGRLGGSPRVWAAGGAAFFALWANLHPGFPAGLALLALYCAGRRSSERILLLAALGAGACGVLLNPYGWGVYWVLFEHALWMPAVSRYILEWQTPLITNPYHLPLYLLAAAVLAACAWRWRSERKPPTAHLAAVLLFGAGSFLHARQASYFVPVALLVLAECASNVSYRKAAAWAGAALYALFVGWLAVPDLKKIPFDYGLFPVEAADFIERNRKTLAHRRVYNEWGWGGYLSERFGSDIRVFMDGRYIFHPLLAEAARANQSPEGWSALMDKYGVEWALFWNRPVRLRVQGPDRTGKIVFVDVPHLEVYMPRERWALVHVDPVARIYVRRGSFNPSWLALLEKACAVRSP
jgi:hypothetical protein